VFIKYKGKKATCPSVKLKRHKDLWTEGCTSRRFLSSSLIGDEWSISHLCHFSREENTPGTHWAGGWVDASTGLQYSNFDPSLATQPRVQSLYWRCKSPILRKVIGKTPSVRQRHFWKFCFLKFGVAFSYHQGFSLCRVSGREPKSKSQYLRESCTRYRSWLRRCTTSRKVAGSTHGEVNNVYQFTESLNPN
jgi:hypothetical protein